MSGRRSFVVLLAVGFTVALFGCGPKRRPEIANGAFGAGRGARPTPLPSHNAGAEPIDVGPDVQPLTADITGNEPFEPSGPDGEGGPLEDIHFGYNQASLTDEARGMLEKHAVWLQSHRDAKVVVEGHCDERGTVEYNLALGDQRARAARDYLANLGVVQDRLKVVSYGKEKPLKPGHDESSWAQNRRAHFQVNR
jgi:peptidoglycan-associated lipoprotein